MINPSTPLSLDRLTRAFVFSDDVTILNDSNVCSCDSFSFSKEDVNKGD